MDGYIFHETIIRKNEVKNEKWLNEGRHKSLPSFF